MTAFLRAHVAIVATTAAVAALIAHQLVVAGLDLDDWDLLFVSRSLTLLAGLWLAAGQRERFEAMAKRLRDRGALGEPAGAAAAPRNVSEVDPALAAVEARAERWSHLGGVGLAALVAMGFVAVQAAGAPRPAFELVAGPLAGAVGGILVGRVLGRMVAYGTFERMLAARGISIRALPEHVDGAAGLEPLGRFYFRQAILLAIPAAFLLAWSILLTLPELEARYGDWRAWYLAGLGVAVLLELTAFVAPLVGVHHAMRRGKQDALATVDKELAPLIATLRERLEQELDGDTRAAVSERLDRLLERVRALEEMPTWPVDRTLWRRLSLGNAALVVGLVAQLAALAGWY